MAQIEEELGLGRKHPKQKSIFALYSLVGIGKSQLAAEFVKSQRQSVLDRMIFWVRGDSKESFGASVLSMSPAIDASGSAFETSSMDQMDERGSTHIGEFFGYLDQAGNDKWLLIIDNLALSPSQKYRNDFDIHSYIGNLAHGSIFITSNHLDTIINYK
ncbi:hypothetical protein B0J14DRAFT_559430 [Halenospora varia]|nr:hypothetical protein B0J14DRAFT_559430 [Halenospora varia]